MTHTGIKVKNAISFRLLRLRFIIIVQVLDLAYCFSTRKIVPTILKLVKVFLFLHGIHVDRYIII